MTAEEFAALVEDALAKADEAELALEVQIEVLERIGQAMRDALTSTPSQRLAC
jgi:hypothetical protein